MAFELRDAGLVAAGAVVGGLARFGVSVLIPSPSVPLVTFPWATLLVNLLGAFAIGAIMLPSGAEHATRLLVVVGFLGAFTTLSTYSLETVDLWRTGHQGLAVTNMGLNGIGGPLMAIAGWQTVALFT